MQDQLLNYINDEILLEKGSSAGPEDELLLDNLLDSMDVVRLVTYIDMEMGIQVPPEQVTIENFRTVSTLAGYLSGLEAGG